MKKTNRILIILIPLTIILNSIDAQVLVRCNQGNFRCMPFDESALDSINITDCDCDDPRNIYFPKKLCYRKITLCTDSLIYPTHDAFDYAHYVLDPLSLINILGPKMQRIVSVMDTSGTINPNLSADGGSNSRYALVVEIDSITGCASFDAWVPMGEAHTFQVFTERTFSEDHYVVEIPSSQPCGVTKTTCYSLKSADTPIALDQSQINSVITSPIEGRISDINIKNIDITTANPYSIDNIALYTPLNYFKRLTKTFSSGSPFSCLEAGVNIGFDDAGPEVHPCPKIDAVSSYSPIDPILDPRSKITSNGDWRLRVQESRIGFEPGDMLNSWELEVCIVEDICGPYLTSADTPLNIGTNPVTIMSTINIAEEGKVTDLKISNLDISHSDISDLKVSLQSPTGTLVVLFDGFCSGTEDMYMAFDSDAILSSPNCGNIMLSKSKPSETFSSFNGEQVQGDWTIIVEDLENGDGGQLESWTLNICTDCKGAYSGANGNILKGSVPTSYSFNARNSIESQQQIISDSLNQTTTADYKSGNSILLKEAFQVNNGQVFNALLENCNN